MKKLARECALKMLDAAARKRTWTPEDRAQWAKAFNALQRLAGKTTVWRRGKLVKDA